MTNKLGSYQDMEDETESGGAFDSKSTQNCVYVQHVQVHVLEYFIWNKATATCMIWVLPTLVQSYM